MTNHSYLFKTRNTKGSVELYEGKMIHQFDHRYSEPRYWINENEGRQASLRLEKGTEQYFDYRKYRVGIRATGRNTDSRTLIVGPIPKDVFCGNSILVVRRHDDNGREVTDAETLVIQGLLNSFAVDFYIRQMVSANINMFYLYQLHHFYFLLL